MQNWCQDLCAPLQNPRWNQVRTQCTVFIQAFQCFLNRRYGWQAAIRYRMYVSYFRICIGVFINHDVVGFDSAHQAVRVSSASKIYFASRFKARMFDTRCFLCMSLLACDQQFFNESFAFINFKRIAQTKS